ncbi:MAG: GyrI-like domain-containing protein [Flavitalea sp.]
MEATTIKPFYLAGISIRTTNEQGKSATDIPQLWSRFFSENIIDKIPHKTDNTLYCAYTNYELDHTRPYTTILGCRVDSLDDLPAELTGKSIDGGAYLQFDAKGKIADGIVFQVWTTIWKTDIPRAFTTDFEVYGNHAQDPDKAEIPVFVAIK